MYVRDVQRIALNGTYNKPIGKRLSKTNSNIDALLKAWAINDKSSDDLLEKHGDSEVRKREAEQQDLETVLFVLLLAGIVAAVFVYCINFRGPAKSRVE